MNSGKYRLVIAAALLTLTLWPASLAIAQSNRADELDQRINELYRAGRFAEAIPLAQEVLAIREKTAGAAGPGVALALDRLAKVYVKQDRYAEAEPLYRRALAIYEQALGPDNRDVATVLGDLAEAYDSQGRHAEAEALHARAVAILEKLNKRERAVESLDERERSRGLSVGPARPAPGPTAIPIFPWPPPAASASYVLPRALFTGRGTIGQAVAAIVAALESQGYVDRSFFATPAGGVALVTRLERINDDGSHVAETQRWPVAGNDQRYSSTFDLARIVRSLFFADPGRYRIIVFIMQNEAFAESDARISEKDARAWLRRGLNRLPAELEDRSFDNGDCTALIYEFVSTGGGVHTVESELTGKQHLRMAGLQMLLGNR